MTRSKGEQLYCLEVSLAFLRHSSQKPPFVCSRRDLKDYSDEKNLIVVIFLGIHYKIYRDVKMNIRREPV